jgi:hypothetical protein
MMCRLVENPHAVRSLAGQIAGHGISKVEVGKPEPADGSSIEFPPEGLEPSQRAPRSESVRQPDGWRRKVLHLHPGRPQSFRHVARCGTLTAEAGDDGRDDHGAPEMSAHRARS